MGWPKNWTELRPMNELQYCKWLMGFVGHAKNEDSRNETLRAVWERVGKKALQRAAGGLLNIPEAQALLSELRQHPKGVDEAWIQLASAATPEDRVRGLRLRQAIASAPHRPGHNEQQPEEYPDALQALPRFLAYDSKAHWEGDSWEDATPRVAQGVTSRVDRLKAIGNGQVPQCAAEAFKRLTRRTP